MVCIGRVVFRLQQLRLLSIVCVKFAGYNSLIKHSVIFVLELVSHKRRG